MNRSRLARLAATPDMLVGGWSGYSPSIRGEVVDALLSRNDWRGRFLDAIAKGSIPAGQVSVAHRNKLTAHRDKSVRARAQQLFSATAANRGQILAAYRHVDRLIGNPRRGHELFKIACAVCHRFRGEGNEVGPDLASVSGKSVPELLTAILDPNAAVEDKFIGYTASLSGDREVSGVIVSETPTTLVLKTAAGTEENVLRKDLIRLRATGLSLMPEGLEAAVRPQAMADLIAYITGGEGE